MIERGEKPRFALESGNPARVAAESFGQHLQRDIPIELRVTCPVDFAHSARAERAEDFVRTEASAW